VCAVVELVPGGDPLTLLALREHCESAGLSRRKCPEQLEVVAAMPRNPTLKVLKYQLKERFS
jgi:non-ribosomal peptide synthetase component E (peptide arylation enzyme)